MKMVSVQEAKAMLSRLIAAAEAGEEIIISRNHKPVAKLSSVPSRIVPTFGFLRGAASVPPDETFDPLSPDDLMRMGWEDLAAGRGSDAPDH